MKQKIILNAFLVFLFPFLIIGQDVNIPDLNFKNALINTLCVDTSGNGIADADADTNNDMEIQISEAQAVQRLYIDNQEINNLTGIEAFVNLVFLNCEDNNFTELIIKDKLLLEEIVFVQYNSQIEKIEITGNPKLTSLQLKGTGFFPTVLKDLIYVNCSNNGLTEFILSSGSSNNIDSQIQMVDCSHNEITSIIISPFFAIDSIDCSYNLIATDINGINKNNAHYIDISNNQISNLIIDKPEIKTLIYNNNPLTRLETFLFDVNQVITGFPLLEHITFGDLRISDHIEGMSLTLNIKDLPLLDNLFLKTSIEDFDIYLDNLPLLAGDLTALNSYVDLQNMSKLEIRINAEKVRLSNSDNLKRIQGEFISSNELYIHDLSEIEYLNFNIRMHNIWDDGDPGLPDSVYLENMPKLDSLIIIGENSFWNPSNINLTINDFPDLEYLSLQQDLYLQTLQLGQLPTLSDLELSVYNIQKLDISQLPQLQNTNIKSLLLEHLTIDHLESLKSLTISSRNLKELYLADLPNLTTFDFYNTSGVIQNTDIFSFISLPKLERIRLMRPVIDSIVLTDLPMLRTFISEEGGTGLSFTPTPLNYVLEDLPSLDSVVLSKMIVESLKLINLPEFKTFIYYRNDGIHELDLNNLSLEHVEIDGLFSDITDVYLTNLSNIKTIDIHALDSVVLDNVNSLESIRLTGVFTQNNLEFVDFPNLDSITIENYLNEIHLENIPNLKYLNLSRNLLNELSIKDLPSLEKFIFQFNNISSSLEIEFQNVNNLSYLDFFGSRNIDYLDLSELQMLSYLDLNLDGASNSTIDYLNLKNGKENIDFFRTSQEVKYVCVDGTSEIEDLIDKSPEIGTPSFSDYCSFIPGGSFSTISGIVYYDNGSGVCDTPFAIANEAAFSLSSNVESITKFIGMDGNFSLESSLIDSSLVLTPKWKNECYSFLPNNYEFIFDSLNQNVNLDFCLMPNLAFNDLEIYLIPNNIARPGFKAKYELHFSNNGSNVISGKVILEYEAVLMQFLDATSIPTNQTSSTIEWEFSDLKPFEKKAISLSMELNSPMSIPALNGGDLIDFKVSVETDLPDKTPQDNEFVLQQEVVNSFDPNDKTCLEGEYIFLNEIDEYVHYLIRFENTGTAQAVNVVIKDKIDTTIFDVKSLLPLKGSHNFVTQIRNENEVEFIFEDIYLPFNDEDNDGNVHFKVKVKEGTELGDMISNSAEIFFDFNFPIQTNVEVSIMVADEDGDGFNTEQDCDDNDSSINPDAEEIPNNDVDEDCDGEDLITSIHEIDNSTIIIFPNPAVDAINIRVTDNLNYSVKLYNLTGKLLVNAVNQTFIDVQDIMQGIYLLEIVNLDSGKKVVERILKGE